MFPIEWQPRDKTIFEELEFLLDMSAGHFFPLGSLGSTKNSPILRQISGCSKIKLWGNNNSGNFCYQWQIFPAEMYLYCVLQFVWQLLELHKPKAQISVHWTRVVKHQTLIKKEHFKINYLMLQKVKNDGNVVKFSICPIESISDLVRQVKKHLSE